MASLGPPRWLPLRLLLLLLLLLLFLWLLLLLLLLLLLPRVGILLKRRAVLGGGNGGGGVQLGPLTGLGGWLARKKESTNNCLPTTLRRLWGSSCHNAPGATLWV